MDDYIDEFSELIDEAGYTDGLSIVMKFRKGLDQDISDHVAEMVQGRPEDNDPDGWYEAAQMFDANRAANQAFHGVQHAVVPTPSTRTTLPISKMFPPAQTPFTMPPHHTPVYPGVPMRASNVPTPMEVDTACLWKLTPVLCRCCREAEHFARDRPKAYDVCYMTLKEKETSPNSSNEITAALDIQPTHRTRSSPPIHLPHW